MILKLKNKKELVIVNNDKCYLVKKIKEKVG